MKLILTISLLLFLVVSHFAQTPEELINRGNERIKSKATLFAGLKDLDDAKGKYLDQVQPMMEKHEDAKALEILNKAIAINLDFSDAPPKEEFIRLKFAERLNNLACYRNRMLSLFRLDKFDEAIADANWLIDHKADGIGDIYFFRAVSYFNKEDYQKALPDFKQAIKFDPKDAQNYFFVGRIYSEQEKWKLAIVNFSKGIALDPKFYSFYELRGFALVKDGQFQNAIPDLTKAIQHKPNDAFNYFYRGTAYKNLAIKQKALADLKKVLELEPDFGNAKKAIEELEK